MHMSPITFPVLFNVLGKCYDFFLMSYFITASRVEKILSCHVYALGIISTFDFIFTWKSVERKLLAD